MLGFSVVPEQVNAAVWSLSDLNTRSLGSSFTSLPATADTLQPSLAPSGMLRLVRSSVWLIPSAGVATCCSFRLPLESTQRTYMLPMYPPLLVSLIWLHLDMFVSPVCVVWVVDRPRRARAWGARIGS